MIFCKECLLNVKQALNLWWQHINLEAFSFSPGPQLYRIWAQGHMCSSSSRWEIIILSFSVSLFYILRASSYLPRQSAMSMLNQKLNVSEISVSINRVEVVNDRMPLMYEYIPVCQICCISLSLNLMSLLSIIIIFFLLSMLLWVL
jgi:hypothetical protein